MAEVGTAVEKLCGASTPSEAITAGTSDAWSELTGLREQYDVLRSAQWFVMGADASRYVSRFWAEDPLASRLCIRNIDDIFPAWRDGASSTFSLSSEPQDPRP